jgi:hypothetical protein
MIIKPQCFDSLILWVCQVRDVANPSRVLRWRHELLKARTQLSELADVSRQLGRPMPMGF